MPQRNSLQIASGTSITVHSPPRMALLTGFQKLWLLQMWGGGHGKFIKSHFELWNFITTTLRKMISKPEEFKIWKFKCILENVSHTGLTHQEFLNHFQFCRFSKMNPSMYLKGLRKASPFPVQFHDSFCLFIFCCGVCMRQGHLTCLAPSHWSFFS